MTYRPDVDGLRAIAILIVVLYHAHVPGFGGGFVGVDVFFVISGYLIIGLLSREFEQTGDLSLLGFFERRIRRLAPALILVLTVTLVLGAIYLTPIGGEQQGLAKSAIATVLLVSNLYFAKTTGGYFDGPAEAQPLLHTWSLSVEEQFYLFWPLVVLVAGRYALRRGFDPMRAVMYALLALLTLSFAVSLWATHTNPQTAFFAAPTRAWEFAVGGGVFFLLRKVSSPKHYGGWLGITGLAAIGFAATAFRSDMPFPGHLALLPVLGSAAVIAGCALTPNSSVARVLSLKPIVAVGLVSYGWYLWHWPLLAIARVSTVNEIPISAIASICFLSLLLSFLTHRLVEAPIRSGRLNWISSSRQIWRTGALALAGVAVLAASLGVWAKFIWPTDPANAAMRDALTGLESPDLPMCVQPRPYLGTLVATIHCALPKTAAPPDIMVWGDSHAFHLAALVSAYAVENQSQALVRFMAGCPPMKGYEPDLLVNNGAIGCGKYNDDVLAEIAGLKSAGLRTVVLAARWPMYFATPEAYDAATVGLQETMRDLNALGIRTLIVAPVPKFANRVPPCLLRRRFSDCGTPRSEAELYRQTSLLGLATSVEITPNARLVDPFPVLCGAHECPPIIDGKVLYGDDNHLSNDGALLLLPVFSLALDWTSDLKASASSATSLSSSAQR